MTLGELINFLKEKDKNKVVPLGFHNPHSYRGYYVCLAFEPTTNITIGKMLEIAEEALGKTFQGYKGGDFLMEEFSDVYISAYGNCGEPLSLMLMTFLVGEIPEMLGTEEWAKEDWY